MAKSITKNYVYNLIYQILTIIAPLITSPYLSRILQADGIGVISYAESIVSYFVLFASMGIALYGQRAISYSQESLEDRSLIFWETQLLKIITASVATGIYLFYAFFVVDGQLTTLYAILSLQIFSVALDVVWFFQGMEEFGKIVFRNIVVRVVFIAFIFIFVKTKDDLIYYVLGNVGISLFSTISLWVYLPKYVKKVPVKSLRPFRNIKTVIALFIPTIAVQIYTVLDKTMIGMITHSDFQNGYYEQAIKIVRMLLTVVGALGTVMIPRVAYYFKKGDDEGVQGLMYKSYRFVWLLAFPMCFGMAMVAGNFVPWFFGPGYEEVVPLLRILSFLILAIGVNGVTGNQYLIPTGREKSYTLTVVIGAVVNLLLNLVLIRFFLSRGAAVASVVAETVIAVVQLVIVRKQLNIFKIIKSSVKYLVSAAVMSLVLWIENKYISPSILNTFIMIISGAAIYLVVLLLLRDAMLLDGIKLVANKIKPKKTAEEGKDEQV